MSCDCLNVCGDDPWLADGRVTACQNLTEAREAQRVFTQKWETMEALFPAYQVTNLLDLATAQALEIERLKQST